MVISNQIFKSYKKEEMNIKVAVVQATPIFFDITKTIDKVEKIVQNYARKGCNLILFPESFIPGYPRGFDFGSKIGNRTDEGRILYKKYWDNSLETGSEEFKRLEKISKENNIYLVTGATERDATNGSLYCSLFYFSPVNGFLGRHQKLKPTGVERLIWAEGDGSSLLSFDTKIGKIGGLICWENYMPLARMSVYKAGVQIYLAPTADARKTWTSTMQHIACEGRCFVLGCNQYFNKSDYSDEYQEMVKNEPDQLSEGGSIIVSPNGDIIEGPLFGEEGVLVADLNLDDVTKFKLDFDVIGHYSRNDVFKLDIKDQPQIIKED